MRLQKEKLRKKISSEISDIGRSKITKENEKMSGNIGRNDKEIMDMRLMSENCNCSVYTMGAVALGILFCIGVVLYALLAA